MAIYASQAPETCTPSALPSTEQSYPLHGNSSGLDVNGGAWVEEGVLSKNGSRPRHREEGQHGESEWMCS